MTSESVGVADDARVLRTADDMAGIAGHVCPRYRLFGDTINTASRMCSISRRNTITLSRAFAECLAPLPQPATQPVAPAHAKRVRVWVDLGGGEADEERRTCYVECHGVVEVKGKGRMQVWNLQPQLQLHQSSHCTYAAPHEAREGAHVDWSEAREMSASVANKCEVGAKMHVAPRTDEESSMPTTEVRSKFVAEKQGSESGVSRDSITDLAGDEDEGVLLRSIWVAGASQSMLGGLKFLRASTSMKDVSMLSKEEAAAVLALGGAADLRISWLSQQFYNAQFERFYLRRHCAQALWPQLCAGGLVLAVVGSVVLADIDLLFSVPALRDAAVALVCCCVLMMACLVVLACLWCASAVESVYGCRCHVQMLASFLFGVGLVGSVLPMRLVWMMSSGEVEVAALHEAIASFWLPRSRAYAHFFIHWRFVHYVCLVSLQALFQLPFGYATLLVLADIAANALVPDLRPLTAVEDSCATTRDVSFGAIGLLQFLCLYNIWLQERLERQQLAHLIKANKLRMQVQGVTARLMPPHVVKAIARRQATPCGRLTSSRHGQAISNPSASADHTRTLAVATLRDPVAAFESWTHIPLAELPSHARPMLQPPASPALPDTDSRLLTRVSTPPCGARATTLHSFYAETLPRVCMLMADVKGFTEISSKLEAQQLFAGVNEMFMRFDELCDVHGVRKIETIGDAYWCAVGLEQPADHNDAARLVAMALDMQQSLSQDGLVALPGVQMRMRIAVHVGGCVGGIVGKVNPRYHLFGQTVDAVMKMEPCGSTDGVVLSAGYVRLLAGGLSLHSQSWHPMPSRGARRARATKDVCKVKYEAEAREEAMSLFAISLRLLDQEYGREEHLREGKQQDAAAIGGLSLRLSLPPLPPSPHLSLSLSLSLSCARAF